jgi:hypothetical protein
VRTLSFGKMMKSAGDSKVPVFSIVLLGMLAALAADVPAQEISVRAAVESESVYMGESFIYQISVEGSDEVSQPDLAPLANDFAIEFLGGSNNSSTSISIINGRMERQVHKGYVFQYRLTPRTKGNVTIPAVAVRVKGQTYLTNPITLGINQPVETNDFKLRISLSRSTCYVGEPVLLTVTWYIGRDVEDFRFTMPILEDAAFAIEDPEVKIDQSKRYYRIPIGASQVVAEKGTGTLDGRDYATISFTKVLIPKRAGTFAIPEVTVECAAVSGSLRGRDFFDDFFNDNFFGMRRGAMKRYVVPSNRASLTVRDLPQEGRPPGFAGLIGVYKIVTNASPTDVSVGDPITLRVVLTGPDYLGNLELPPLQNQPELSTYFKIPDERADGKIVGKTKVFTQTIRAKNENVKEIPPIAISYFNTRTGRYESASSEPIPITVRPTKVVTAVDAEGAAPGPIGSPLESWKQGIAYNYEGPALLEGREFGLVSALGSAPWLAILVLPPAAYLALVTVLVARRRREADTESRKARTALRRLRERLDALRKEGASGAALCEKVLGAMREYLGDKFTMPGATLTVVDVEKILREKGVSVETITSIGSFMSSCEAGAYAGDHSAAADPDSFIMKARQAAEGLERSLR